MSSIKLSPADVRNLYHVGQALINANGEARKLPLADQLAEARAEAFFHNNQRAIAERRLDWFIRQEQGRVGCEASLLIPLCETREEVITIIDRELLKEFEVKS